MKITDIRWTPAFIPIEAPLRYSIGSHPGFSRIVIEVETDEGITGLGECYSGASRAGQLAELKPLLIGEDPMNLERIRWKVAAPSSEKLFGFVLGFAGLEFAILDIQGKALKRSVCDLLGGRIRRRGSVRRLSFLSLCRMTTALAKYRTSNKWSTLRKKSSASMALRH